LTAIGVDASGFIGVAADPLPKRSPGARRPHGKQDAIAPNDGDDFDAAHWTLARVGVGHGLAPAMAGLGIDPILRRARIEDAIAPLDWEFAIVMGGLLV
jgi:hypothetical protein